MNEQVAKISNEKEPWPRGWWRFPLLPMISIKQQDDWNNWGFSFDWMFIKVWNMDSVELSVQFSIEEQLSIKIFVPYLIVYLHIPVFPVGFLQKHLWKKTAGLKKQIDFYAKGSVGK